MSDRVGTVAKKLSGAENRKKAKEKQERENEVIKKTPKIGSFFASAMTHSSSILSVEPPDNICKQEISINNSDNNRNILQVPNDPIQWNVDDAFRELVAKDGFKQNDDIDFSNSKRQYADQSRYLSKSYFSKRMGNGEVVKRSWLVYSPSTGNVFCAPCKLYGGTTLLATTGFNDWKNSKGISEHDNSFEHQDCVRKFVCRSTVLERVDSELVKQYNHEVEYWKNVLKSVVETVKYIASRGLPFFGDNEIIGSSQNGNFLGCI